MILSILTMSAICTVVREQAKTDVKRTLRLGIVAGGTEAVTLSGRSSKCPHCGREGIIPTLYELATSAADMSTHAEAGVRLSVIEPAQVDALRFAYIETFACSMRETYESIAETMRGAARDSLHV
jgi:hypothetical protein